MKSASPGERPGSRRLQRSCIIPAAIPTDEQSLAGCAAVNSGSYPGVVLPRELREQYYAAGHWRTEDFWTTFEKVAARDPRATAYVEGERSISFVELAAEARRFGSAALARGLQAGDVMIVHGRHCIEANVAILGCAYAKLVVALLPHMFSAEQIRSTIEAAGAKAIVGLGEPAETERVRSAADALQLGLVVIRDESAGGAGSSWSDFVRSGSTAEPPRTPMSAEDLVLLTFSSGTTGTPKGVMHSSNTLRFAAETYARVQGIGPADTSLVVTAFGFIGSSVLGTYLTYFSGCRTVLLRNWNVDDTLALIQKHRATHILLMPTHAIDVLNSPKLDATDCSSLRRGVLAGLGEPHRLDARKRLCAKPFPMYGMSESPGHCTGWMEDDWERLRTTEGRPLPGTEVLICDDDERPLPAGEPGNILLRGPNRFLGYYRADELNKASFSTQGYLRTGDIGVLDADGYMTFMTRSKDIIRRGGVTITPADVEAALRPHPRIADVAVIGLPDPRLGERTCACVITRDGEDVSLEELTAFLQGRDFARYQWPEHVVRCETFPRTPSLKVQKPELRKQVIARLEGKG